LPSSNVTAPEQHGWVPRLPQESKVLHRTARVELRVTATQRERCFALLRSGGDVWAAVLELNALRQRRNDVPVVSYQALCWELTRSGPGCAAELSSVGARSILRRYSDAWFSTNARRRGGDGSARYPRRRRSLLPSRYYAGTFVLGDRHLTLPTARGGVHPWCCVFRGPSPTQRAACVRSLCSTWARSSSST
jgi:hypothetical protein